jgi:hypothetical protein
LLVWKARLERSGEIQQRILRGPGIAADARDRIDILNGNRARADSGAGTRAKRVVAGVGREAHFRAAFERVTAFHPGHAVAY